MPLVIGHLLDFEDEAYITYNKYATNARVLKQFLAELVARMKKEEALSQAQNLRVLMKEP